MSPRKKNVLVVESWPDLKGGRLHKGQVKKIYVDRKTCSLHVTIENLDPGQIGRIHEIDLPLPARPGNKICVFLEARGLNADTAGTTICLDQVTNAVVGMRFRGVAAPVSSVEDRNGGR